MIQTEYGTFDGDSWQRICKIVFLQKYESEFYLEIVASPGDYGLEGFTKDGKAFQCYCPSDYYSADELYEKQRDKITKDLNKLKLYENDLKKRLGNTKIHTWFFVTPQFKKNEILIHCVKKTDEVKKWNLSIIENTQFNVIPRDIDFLHPELKIALNADGKKLMLKTEEITETEIIKYKKEGSDYLVSNAQKKHTKRLEQANVNLNTVDKLVHKTIGHFLAGEKILKKFREFIPEEYEKFVKIIKQKEGDIEDICLFPSDNYNERYRNIKLEIEEKINSNFTKLDGITIKDLADYVIADWILRCPLDFLEKNES